MAKSYAIQTLFAAVFIAIATKTAHAGDGGSLKERIAKFESPPEDKNTDVFRPIRRHGGPKITALQRSLSDPTGRSSEHKPRAPPSRTRTRQLSESLMNDPNFHGGAGAGGGSSNSKAANALAKMHELSAQDLVTMTKDLPMMQLMVVNYDNDRPFKVTMNMDVALQEYAVKGQERGLDKIQRAVACECEKSSNTVCLTVKKIEEMEKNNHEFAWLIHNMITYDTKDEKLYWVLGPAFRIPKNATRPDGTSVAIGRPLGGDLENIGLPEAPSAISYNQQARIHLAQRSNFLKGITFRIADKTPRTKQEWMKQKDEQTLNELGICGIKFQGTSASQDVLPPVPQRTHSMSAAEGPSRPIPPPRMKRAKSISM